MRDVCVGACRKIKCEDVKVLNVPYFEQLTIERMLEFAAQHDEVMKALPELERERLKLPRSYLANVLYTLLGDAFKDWVQVRVEARNAHHADKQNENIPMDAEIAALFH